MRGHCVISRRRSPGFTMETQRVSPTLYVSEHFTKVHIQRNQNAQQSRCPRRVRCFSKVEAGGLICEIPDEQ
ncbi:hypothetical protein BHM03_00045610 [Ensete ventricosum]|nr:hypothetical protein BHM03_00045610 [Ensete ventricosum]